MTTTGRRWGGAAAVLGVCLLSLTAFGGGGTPACGCGLTLDGLMKLSECQLEELFRNGQLNHPLNGTLNGRLVYLTDRRLPKLKLAVAKATWRGKLADGETGYFINRFVGGINWLDSYYVIGPSWIDGKPAVVMEYPPKTPLFGPMHDELREVAPGIWLGPVFERFPCVKFRGYVALEETCDSGRRGLFRRR